MLPSATYSSKLLGMAPSQLDRLRTATASALMPKKGGRCRTTTLAIVMGDSEPGISVGVELIRSGWTWWTAHPTQQRAAERAWNIARPRIEQFPPAQRWGRARGLRSSPLYWMRSGARTRPLAGRKATAADVVVNLSPILSAVAESLSDAFWKRASAQWHGGGAAPSPSVIRVVFRSCCASTALCLQFASFLLGTDSGTSVLFRNGQLEALEHVISSAATRKMLGTEGEMKARSGPLFRKCEPSPMGTTATHPRCLLRLKRSRRRYLSSD